MSSHYFNSIKVRLEPWSASAEIFWTEFQFHKGTIRTGEHIFQVARISPFQFHKGTIRTSPSRTLPFSVRYFNSIKVRLELPTDMWFTRGDEFQFHKGTIRTPPRHRSTSKQQHFNSIKVRLEPSSASGSSAALWFQFHKGTIRTASACGKFSAMTISIP